MTIRITDKDLEYAVNRLNRAKGYNEQPHSKTPEGKYKANINTYYIDGAYGGVKLVQIVSEGGGIRVISQGGYSTKRELYNTIHSILQIVEDEK